MSEQEGYGPTNPDVIVIDREKEAEKEKLEKPKKYHVFILNDDYSRWDFVVDMLMKIFGQSEDQANCTTRTIHTKGKGLAGTYTKDIAETKADQLNQYAQANEFPLHAETEEVQL